MIAGVRRNVPEAFLDVHLMVERPGDYVGSFAKAGANLFSFHMEVCKPMRPSAGGGADPAELIRRIRDAGMHPGMVVNRRPRSTSSKRGSGRTWMTCHWFW